MVIIYKFVKIWYFNTRILLFQEAGLCKDTVIRQNLYFLRTV